MPIQRVLLAIDDSAPALAAARLAVELAAGWHAQVRAVWVRPDGEGSGFPRHFLDRLAATSAVPIEEIEASGEPFEVLLREARSWDAQLIVMGRSNRAPGAPYVGSQTEHLLEFTAVPVLVVPGTRPAEHR